MSVGARVGAAIVLVAVVGGAAWWWTRERPSAAATQPVPLDARGAEVASSALAEVSSVDESVAPEVASAERREIEAEVAPRSDVGEEPRDATLGVVVLAKESGEPIAGVRLMATHVDRNGHCSHVDSPRAGRGECPITGADGRAQIAVVPGIAGAVDAWGTRSNSEKRGFPAIDAGAAFEIVFELPTRDDALLYGRLVDTDTQAPISGTVGFVRGGSSTSPVATDGSGDFQLGVASWESAWASAAADGYARTIFRASEAHGDPAATLVVRLSRAASLAVTVRDLSGAPIDGARVEVATASYEISQGSTGMFDFYFGEDPTWSATTGSDGRAVLEDIAPRVPLRLSVSASGWPTREEAEPLRLEPAERRELLVTLGSGATVSGRLEDGLGTPIANREIWRRAAEYDAPEFFESYDQPVERATTDADGRFEMQPVPAGKWWIGPAPDDDDLPALAQLVVVERDGGRIEVALRADRGLHIRGRVLGPDGTPVPECDVSARSAIAFLSIWEQADSAGEFSVGPVPAGTWNLAAGAMHDVYAACAPVEVQAGTDGVVLVLRVGGRIEGEVIDASTEERREAELMLVRLDVERAGWMMTMGRQDGTFDFGGLSIGSYSVVARTRDGKVGARGPLEVDAGAQIDGVRIEVAPGARLDLAYAGAGPAAECEIYVDGLRLPDTSAPRTRVERVIVPPGNVEVRWRDRENPGTPRSEKLALRAGDEHRLELRTGP